MTPFTGIIDVFYGDANAIRKRGHSLTDALKLAKMGANLSLVFIKCTEGGDGPDSGTPYVDPEFNNWCNACVAAGVERAFYHVGTDSQDGGGQANFFAATLRKYGFNPAKEVCALDRETGKPNMTSKHAEQFITAWRAQFNRWVAYYRSLSSLRADATDPDCPSVLKCPPWVAGYGEFGPDGPHTPVPWWIWQYMGAESGPGEWPADPVAYPRVMAGVGVTDRNAYAGTSEQLIDLLETLGA